MKTYCRMIALALPALAAAQSTAERPSDEPENDPAETRSCHRCEVEPTNCDEALRMVLPGGCASDSDCDTDALFPSFLPLYTRCRFEFDDIVSASRRDSCFDSCDKWKMTCPKLMTQVAPSQSLAQPPGCASSCSHDAILAPYQALGCDFDIALARGLRFKFNEELIVRAADEVIVAPGVPFVPEVARASTSSGIGEFTEICGHWFWNNHNGATAVCNALGYPSGSLEQERWARTPEDWTGNVLGTDALFIGECNPGETLGDCSANQNRYDYSCKAGSRAGIVVICSDVVPEPVPPECLRCEVEPANCGEALRMVLPGGCASDCDFDALEPYIGYFEEVHGVECRFAFEGIMHGLALGPVEHPACTDSATYADPTYGNSCSTWDSFGSTNSFHCAGFEFSDELTLNCPTACNVEGCVPTAPPTTGRDDKNEDAILELILVHPIVELYPCSDAIANCQCSKSKVDSRAGMCGGPPGCFYEPGGQEECTKHGDYWLGGLDSPDEDTLMFGGASEHCEGGTPVGTTHDRWSYPTQAGCREACVSQSACTHYMIGASERWGHAGDCLLYSGCPAGVHYGGPSVETYKLARSQEQQAHAEDAEDAAGEDSSDLPHRTARSLRKSPKSLLRGDAK